MSAEKSSSVAQKDSFDAVCLRIDGLLGRKKWNEALNLLKRGNEETSEAFSSERGEIFRELRLAYLFFSLGDLRKAQQYLDQILEENESDGQALLMKGYFCLLEENKGDAIYFYTSLLTKKLYQVKAQKVLSAIKDCSNVLNLTMKKKVDFFIEVPSVSFQQNVVLAARAFVDFCVKFFSKWSTKRFLFRLNIIVLTFLVILLSLWQIFDKKSDESFSLWLSHQWKKVISGETLETYDENSLWRTMQWDVSKSEKVEDSKHLLESSLKDIYRKMEKSIFEKNINAAIVHYNKALILNPPTPILQKFEVLAGFIPKPQWHTFLGDQKDMSILHHYPKLYHNTYWKLSGKVSNVLLRGDILRFRLLIFKDNNLKEVVTMEFEAPQIIPVNGQQYQMLVRFLGYDQKKNLAMRGVMMRRVEQR